LSLNCNEIKNINKYNKNEIIKNTYFLLINLFKDLIHG